MNNLERVKVGIDVAKLRARDLMTRRAITVSPDDTIHSALVLMQENNLTTLPVIDSRDHVIGMISIRDLTQVLTDLDLYLGDLTSLDAAARDWVVTKTAAIGKDQIVGQFMVESAASVGHETPIEIISSEFLRNRVHHLPVVDVQNHIVGIVSTMDVINAVAEHCRAIAAQSDMAT